MGSLYSTKHHIYISTKKVLCYYLHKFVKIILQVLYSKTFNSWREKNDNLTLHYYFTCVSQIATFYKTIAKSEGLWVERSKMIILTSQGTPVVKAE